MKKKLFLRGALGFPIGIAIGYVITICISLMWAGGYYSPCAPELAEALGNEISAVILQALLCGLLGETPAFWKILRVSGEGKRKWRGKRTKSTAIS